jgi:hypothetical protein
LVRGVLAAVRYGAKFHVFKGVESGYPARRLA